MQSVSSRIWTRVGVFISYDDNDYTTGTSLMTMKGYSALLRFLKLAPHHQMQLSVILRTSTLEESYPSAKIAISIFSALREIYHKILGQIWLSSHSKVSWSRRRKTLIGKPETELPKAVQLQSHLSSSCKCFDAKLYSTFLWTICRDRPTNVNRSDYISP